MERYTRIPVPSQPTSPRRAVALSPTRSTTNKQIAYKPTHNITQNKHMDRPQGENRPKQTSPQHFYSPASSSFQEILSITPSSQPRALVPESKSVTFVSPIHQVHSFVESSMSSSSLTTLDHAAPVNPLHTVPTVGEELVTESLDLLPDKSSHQLRGVPSFDSLEVTSSEVSLSSRRSLPVPLKGKRNKIGQDSLEEELLKAETIDRNAHMSTNLHRPSSMPELLLSSPQLQLLKLEKESLSSQLKEAHSEISLLKAKNKSLTERDCKYQGKVWNLESSIQTLQQMVSRMKLSHTEELANLKRTMRAELEAERQRLLNQIRQQTKLKEEVSAKVHTLEGSLEQVKRESATEKALKDRLCKLDSNHELAALKVELNALKDLHQEIEQSHDLLVQTTKEQEQEIMALRQEKNRLLSSSNRNGSENIEVPLMKIKLETAEARVAELEKERVSAVVAVEEKLIAHNVKAEMEHEEAMNRLKQQLEMYKATVHAGKDNSPDSSTSPMGHSGRYFAGRWTAQRADVRKYAEEMQLITDTLEKEGYGPSQASADEVIRHLWWKNENCQKELTKKQKSLLQALGRESSGLLKELEQEKLEMEKRLQEVHQRMAETEKTAQVNLDLIRKKLNELLKDKQVDSVKYKTLQRKEGATVKENQELKSRLNDFQVKAATKSALMAELEADASTSKRESTSHQACLAAEKHQNTVLKAKVEALTSQLTSRQKQLADSLGKGGQHTQNATVTTLDEVTAMRAKIGELQGEVKLQKQQLNHITTQRDTLLERIDSLSLQIVTLESHLSKENTNSDMIKSKLSRMSDELHSKTQELGHVSERKAELQVEVTSIRRDLQAAQENVNTLEAELASLQREYNSCCEELSSSKATSNDLEMQFLSVSADATYSEQTVDTLQASLKASEKRLETTRLSLEGEKQANKDLRNSLDRTTGNYNRTSKKLESVDGENTQLKKDLTSKKQDIQLLQQEARSLRLELNDSQAKTTSLQSESTHLQQEIKTRSKELTKSKEMVSTLRQKLTDNNRDLTTFKLEVEQLRSQLTSTEAENFRLSKARDGIQSEVQELKAKLLAQSNNLTEKNHLLLKKEEELRTVTQGKVALTTEVSSLKRDIHVLTSSKSKVDKGLSLKGSELDVEKRKLIECQHSLEVKVEELRKTRLEVDSLQCSLDCEAERFSTLELELSSVQAELQDANERHSKLTAEMEQLEVDHSSQIKMSKESMHQVENKLIESRSKCTDLEAQVSALNIEMEKGEVVAEGEKKELKVQISTLTSKLAGLEQDKTNLNSELITQKQRMQATEHDLNEQVEEKRAQVEKLETDLSIAQTQIKHLTKDLEEFQQQLEGENARRESVQKELNAQVATNNSISTELGEVEQMLDTERRRTENLTSGLLKSELKAQELSKELHETQQQLYCSEESVEETQSAFTNTMNSVKACHEQEKYKLQLENEQLGKSLNSTKENLAAVEHQLQTCEGELTTCCGKLTHMEQRCTQLESMLTTESKGHRELESYHTELQSTHAEARMQIADLSEKLLVQTTIAEQLKVEAQTSKHECESLQEQLQLQRETAAASLNRIQRHNQDKCAELHGKIQEQAEKLKEAQESIRAFQHETVTLKADSAQLESSLLDEKQHSSQLLRNLNSETTSLKLCEQKIEQLERLNQLEQSTKAKMESHLEEEVSQRKKAEEVVETQKQDLVSRTQELASTQASLASETAKNEKLKGDVILSQAEVTSLNQRLGTVSSAAHEFKVKSEQELQSLRQKYHTDKKVLKEKLREIQRNLQVLSGQHESRGEELSRLQAANQTLTKDQKELTKQLSDKKYELQEKKEDCKNLQAKVTSLEAQIKQLDREMSLLGEAQQQYEQYKKRLEQQSRDEAQRILTEVTDHMEQQYTAHKYLETLRTENEKINLKEKEREISQLRSELGLKKQENKQDKMRMQHLEVETRHLKAQQKDHERSRRRLEARLEQVNDTLSRTLPVSQLSESYRSTAPMHSSTPRFKSGGR